MTVYSAKGKEVVSADTKTQALLEMWDDNILTCDVDKKIGDKVKEGDIVLVDYSFADPKVPMARQVVVKILKGKTAKTTWTVYQENFKKIKQKSQQQQQPPAPKVQQGPAPQMYG